MGLSRVPITARDSGKVGKAVAKSHAGEALRQTCFAGTIQRISRGHRGYAGQRLASAATLKPGRDAR